VLTMKNRRKGMRWTHVVSMLTGGVLALWRAQHKDYTLAIFFGIFALINYQTLQTLHHAATYGGYEDDADWRKR